jgi:6-phosphogluconolactonase (cycloisomerase 2 family)
MNSSFKTLHPFGDHDAGGLLALGSKEVDGRMDGNGRLTGKQLFVPTVPAVRGDTSVQRARDKDTFILQFVSFMRILACLLVFFTTITARAQSYYLLVGTYTNMGSNTPDPPKDSTGSRGIYVYKFEAGTGRASFLSHTTGVVNPSFLEIAPDKRHVYACTETRTTNAGSISAFLLDRGSGALRFINKVPGGGDNPVYVSVHRSGRWAAMANYTGGSLSVFPIRPDGALLPYVQNFRHTGHSIDPARQDRPHVHSVVFSPDNRTLYAQDLGEDSISIYEFSSAMDRPLRSVEKIPTTPGSGPRHLTFHPNGRYAYLIEEMAGCVDVYHYYPGTGHLRLLQRIPAHADTAKGPFRSSDIHVSADGRFLYVTNRQSESNLAIFSVDPAKGALKTIGYQSVLGKEPRNFLLDPTGGFLLVANQDSNAVIIFRVDKNTGLLEPTGQRLDLPSPSCLKMVE